MPGRLYWASVILNFSTMCGSAGISLDRFIEMNSSDRVDPISRLERMDKKRTTQEIEKDVEKKKKLTSQFTISTYICAASTLMFGAEILSYYAFAMLPERYSSRRKRNQESLYDQHSTTWSNVADKGSLRRQHTYKH